MKKRFYPDGDNKQRAEDLWDKVFSTVSYDEYLKTLEYDEPARVIQQAFDGISREIRILDVGCGGGRFISLLRQMGFKNVHGLDLSDVGLRKTRENNDDVMCVRASASSIPFKDGAFDAVLMVGVVYEIEDRQLHARVFREISRILKRNGSFVFVNNSPYWLGERIYSLSECFRNKGKGRFFVWRYADKDVRNLSKKNAFSIYGVRKCNAGMALYRLMNGLLVRRDVRLDRLQRINTINPYSIHEHYQANRSSRLFNCAGRLMWHMRRLMQVLIYNSTVYNMKKMADTDSAAK